MNYSKTFEGVAGKIAFSLNRDLDEDEVALFEQKMIDLVEGFKLDLHGNIPGDCKPAVGTRAYKLAKEKAYEARYVFDTSNKPDEVDYRNLVLFFKEAWNTPVADTKRKLDGIFASKEPLALDWQYVGSKGDKSYAHIHLENELKKRNLLGLVKWEERQQSDDKQFQFYV